LTPGKFWASDPLAFGVAHGHWNSHICSGGQ
jgi:hypothetical protein